MFVVNTIDVCYLPGDFMITHGHKKGEKKHFKKNGGLVNPIGYGNATEVTGSRLYLYVKTTEGTDRVRIDPFFRKRGMRMSESRVDKLKATMPDTVSIISRVSESGYEYNMVSDADMKQWCDEASIKVKSKE